MSSDEDNVCTLIVITVFFIVPATPATMSSEGEYTCSLTETSLKKAKTELNEDPKNRMGAVETFRTWIKQQPHFRCKAGMILLSVCHYSDVKMSTVASQIPGVSIVYSTVCSGADQRKHQSSASLAFVKGIHWWPVNSQHRGTVTRKMFPFAIDVSQNVCRKSVWNLSQQMIRYWLSVYRT